MLLCPHSFPGSHPLFGQEVLFRSASVGSEANVISSSPKASVPSHPSRRPISTSAGSGPVAAPLKMVMSGMCNLIGLPLFSPRSALHASETGPSCAGSG